MPRISAFYGVVIYMYWNERDHPVAHFHAYHAGRRASVSANGDVLAGGLDPKALQFVREWAALRRGEILANWERARRNEPLLGIEPLGKIHAVDESYLPVVVGAAVIGDRVLRLLLSEGTAGDV